MADYQKIVRHRPEVREFIRNRRWVHRGEAIAYGANISCDAFSTDAIGYRHSMLGGKTFSAADCFASERYGLVLGPSSVYGFGLAGNENTIPSRIAEQFGFPFANIGLPEGNSRNLFSILLNILSRTARPPTVVLHISGGDYTSFCYSGIADPVFGPPNLLQTKAVLQERGGRRNPDKQVPSLLAFTTLWINAVIDLCRLRQVPLVLGDDTTFFEKRNPSDLDRECRLGEPSSPAQKAQFDTQKRFATEYHSTRKTLAERRGVPLAGPGLSNDLGFIDEFHYDVDGTRALSDEFARAIETVL
jgi:hypothetical protein